MSFTQISEIAANFAQIITAIALIIAGIWSLINYYQNKRSDAAKWLHDLGQEFQFSDELKNGKFLLDFRYQDTVEPLLSSLVFNQSSALTEEQLLQSIDIDKVLNQFEHLLFLKENGHITQQDLDTYFGYWIGLLKKQEHGVLRRYCTTFGYELLTKNSYPQGFHAHQEEYLIVYGSLKNGSKKFHELGMDKRTEYIGERNLKGRLFDLGDYPGLVLEPALYGSDKTSTDVTVQLFRIKENIEHQTRLQLLTEIDAYEDCNLQDPTQSEYRRTTVPIKLENGQWGDAWIYLYQRDFSDKLIIDEWVIKQ